jgi:demethylmenaquinone methyltransferase/2-methoxy-6-polyprenyl-1,4-benzoquinol methylase
MGSMTQQSSEASAKWIGQGSGAHYESARFSSERARGRDIRCVNALISELLGAQPVARLLDVPCGSGRLTRDLSARAALYVGADISPSMLGAARPACDEAGPRATLALADGLALPFASHSFDVVVACRWLHHLHDEDSLRQAIAELVRVSRGMVIASFWDERSLPGWRRSLGLKRAEGPAGRSAKSRAQIAGLFERAGADVLGWRATMRFFSQQTFVAARVRAVRT